MRRGLPARPAASPRRAVARAVLVTRSPLVTRAAVATRATLVAALAALAAAAARPLAAQGADSTTVPVLFSVSGAASLGTYQSGVTWAVVRFLQLANGDSTLRPSAHRALRYRLGAISGASAGNINAVISSLEWCRKDAVRPENSLFAQLWLNVGLGQLNPVHDSGGATLPSSGRAPGAAGLMSRAFFQTLWDSLTAAMARPLFDPRCDIPVGVTMTRLIPAMYSLQRTDETDPALTAATQRFVARWRVQADSAGLERDRAPLVVRPPEIPRDPRLFGAEYLISIGADRSGKDTVDRRIVFGAVQASAAVPLVWAAVPLPTPVDSNFAARAKRASLERAFRAEARAGGTGGAGARVPKDSALFVDGGLFDADPLGLANDMWSQERATPGSREARPLLVRIDPDDLRGLLLLNTQQKEAASGAAKQPPPSGIEPVLTLLGGFLPSARGYELQSLGRLLARHANDPVSPRIVHTSRAFPAVAAHLLHFGGFMGRPFRDHDFYLGIYDGLRFAAEQLLCADPVARDAAPPAASCVDSVLTHTVIPAVERALPDAQPIPLVREFARCESLGWRDDACTFPPDTLTRDPLLRARYRVEATIARANQQMLHYTPPPKDTTRPRQCGPRACDGFVASIVWNDDFGVLLSSLAADTGYRSAIRTMHALTKPVCWGREAAWGSPDPTCPADSAFARLVNDPETVLDFALRWELRRLSEIEERQRRGSKTASRIAALTELAYTAQGFPYRTGHFAPTTVPALAPKRLAWNLLPYYVAAGAPGRGGVELGWDFVLRYWRDAHVGITAPISWWYRPGANGARTSQALAFGLGAFVRPPPAQQWLAFQVAVQYPGEAVARGLWSARLLSPELAWTPPLASKLRFAYRWGPSLFDPSRAGFGPAPFGNSAGGRGGGAGPARSATRRVRAAAARSRSAWRTFPACSTGPGGCSDRARRDHRGARRRESRAAEHGTGDGRTPRAAPAKRRALQRVRGAPAHDPHRQAQHHAVQMGHRRAAVRAPRGRAAAPAPAPRGEAVTARGPARGGSFGARAEPRPALGPRHRLHA